MSRGPMLVLVVGKKKIGKSWTTREVLNQYVAGNPSAGTRGRKSIIFDTQNEYSIYPEILALALNNIALFSVHPEISIRRIPPFKLRTGEVMTPDEKAQAVQHILSNFRNGLVVLEDINEYIGDHLPQDVVGIILSQRHKGLDIILHYHSFGRVQKKIWPHVNLIRMHKCNDSVIDNKDKFPDKFECFSIAENIVNNQYNAGNIRFYLYIDFDMQKILCEITVQEKDEAVLQYLRRHHARLIKPYLDMRNAQGKKEYSYVTAFEAEKHRIIKTYFPD
jgi:hypothetical protein